MKHISTALIISVFAASIAAGCNQNQDQDTQKEVSQGAQQAWDKTKQAAQAIGKTVSKDTQQMTETAKVKGPIDASKDIDSSEVSVETVGKTIYINGSVPTAEQKEKVLKMAKANADKEYTIDDHLKVATPKLDDSTPAKKADNSNPPITDDQGR